VRGARATIACDDANEASAAAPGPDAPANEASEGETTTDRVAQVVKSNVNEAHAGAKSRGDVVNSPQMNVNGVRRGATRDLVAANEAKTDASDIEAFGNAASGCRPEKGLGSVAGNRHRSA
jgi:hypothetical protein